MSADLLREAAAKMRERAEAAADAPWEAVQSNEGLGYFDVVRAGDDASVAELVYPVDAEHIASWHPAVALAVADWLEFEARCADRANANYPGHDFPPDVHALAVARAYLGRDA